MSCALVHMATRGLGTEDEEAAEDWQSVCRVDGSVTTSTPAAQTKAGESQLGPTSEVFPQSPPHPPSSSAGSGLSLTSTCGP